MLELPVCAGIFFLGGELVLATVMVYNKLTEMVNRYLAQLKDLKKKYDSNI
jgi:hypothetical protein